MLLEMHIVLIFVNKRPEQYQEVVKREDRI